MGLSFNMILLSFSSSIKYHQMFYYQDNNSKSFLPPSVIHTLTNNKIAQGSNPLKLLGLGFMAVQKSSW